MMKENIYRCNCCRKIIDSTVHRIDATDENGEKTKYGALFDDMDFCEGCISLIVGKVLDEVGDDDGEKMPEIQSGEKTAYKCSEVGSKCVYRGKAGISNICNYLEIEGCRRGCSPENCDKFKPKSQKRAAKKQKFAGGSR